MNFYAEAFLDDHAQKSSAFVLATHSISAILLIRSLSLCIDVVHVACSLFLLMKINARLHCFPFPRLIRWPFDFCLMCNVFACVTHMLYVYL